MAICKTSSGAVDKMCLLITLAIVAALVYVGVKEMRKLNLPTPFKKSGGAGGKASKQQHRVPESERGSEAPMMRSGRAATNVEPTDLVASASAATAQRGSHIDTAFEEIDVDATLARIAPKQADSKIDSSYFMQDFLNEDASAFKTIEKEDAMRSATIRPAQMAESGRQRPDGAPSARQIGLSPMEFARPTIQRPVDPKNATVAFNDVDARHAIVHDKKPVCDHSTANHTPDCPWD